MKKLKWALLIIAIAFISSVNFNSSELSLNEASADATVSEALAQGFTVQGSYAHKESGGGWTPTGYGFLYEWYWNDTDGDGDFDTESYFEMVFYNGDVIHNEVTFSNL